MSLNLSRASIKDNKLFNHAKSVVEESALCPRGLHIGISESAALEYLDEVHELGVRLNRIGCRLVLDDFGHGRNQYRQRLAVEA